MSDEEPEGGNGSIQPGGPARDTREGFADLLRELFIQTGMSTNQFESVHGFSDGTVSKHQSAKTVPPLEFVEALLDEVQRRVGMPEEAADQIVKDYGRLLHRLVETDRPHQLHKVLLQVFTLTMTLRSRDQELTEVSAELQRLREELAAASQTPAREDAIRAEEQQLLARRDALLAQRDEAMQELAVRQQEYRQLARQAGESPFQETPDLPDAHTPQPALASGEHGPHASSRFLLVVAAASVVVLVLGLFAIYRVTGQKASQSSQSLQSPPPSSKEEQTGRPPAEPQQSGPSSPEAATPAADPKPSHYKAIDIADGYVISLAEDPPKPYYADDGDFEYNGTYPFTTSIGSTLVLLKTGQTGSLDTCRSDTRYTKSISVDKAIKESRICIITSAGHVGLVTVKGYSPDGSESTYATVDLTVWRNAMEPKDD